MNWKFWNWPAQIEQLKHELREEHFKQEYATKECDRLENVIANAKSESKPQFVLHGWSEGQMRAAFAKAPDDGLFKATLEQCDQLLFETVQDLVNQAEDLPDGVVRQRVGELRGITQLREKLTEREAQARADIAGRPAAT